MKTAVVLFNLGGPDRRESVGPFLFNLFSDPAIISLPQPFRWLIAKWIAIRRTKLAQSIYAKISGSSPLLANTEAQAEALDTELGPDFQSFIAMRYWHPRAAGTVRDVMAWQPDRLVLLPLYPQFSGTTTASSVAEWRDAARRAGLSKPTTVICCWPDQAGLVEAVTGQVRQALTEMPEGSRILFSAHGLPQKVVDSGDPYQWQVARSVDAVMAALGMPAADYRICYQSRVGPLQWLEPSIETEISRAGAERKPVLVVPISFVSEHSETLVELDIDYRDLAARQGVPVYHRVATVGVMSHFIASLAGLVRKAAASGTPLASCHGVRICPAGSVRCAYQTMRAT